MALSLEVVEEYRNSLQDLTVNSKPLINMLTMLAEDHEQHAGEIVKLIEDHITKCKTNKKLPVLYLMDSIMKNLGRTSYKSLFMKNIAQTFTAVFEQVDEKTRSSMYKLRQTWASILPNQQLYQIDIKIKTLLDPAWPVTAKPPQKSSIYVNPKFLSKSASSSERSSPEMLLDDEEDDVTEEEEDEEMVVEEEEVEEESVTENLDDQEAVMRKQLIAKQQELLQLKQARLELELAEAREQIKMVKKQAPKTTASKVRSLPLPTIEPIEEIPDIPPAPRDPRRRSPKTKTKPRDPRLKQMEATSTDDVSSTQDFPQTRHAVPPYQAPTSTIPHMPAAASVHPRLPQHPAHYPEHAQLYNGIPNPAVLGMPHQPTSGADMFTGEVFGLDEVKFSDEDSDSSRCSSIQSQSKSQPVLNVRDPRLKDVRDPRLRDDNRGPHGGSASSSSVHSTDRSAVHNTDRSAVHNSHSHQSKSSSNSKGHSWESKERRSKSPVSRTSSGSVSAQSSIGNRVTSSASSSSHRVSSSAGRVGSKEKDVKFKDVKSESKSKDLQRHRPDDRKKPSPESAASKLSGKSKDIRSERDRPYTRKQESAKRSSKERERSPAKSPKSSSSSKSSSHHRGSDRSSDKKDGKSEEKRAESKPKSVDKKSDKVKSSTSDTNVKSKHEKPTKSKSEEKMDTSTNKETTTAMKIKQEKRSMDNEDTAKANKKPRKEVTEKPEMMDVAELKQEPVVDTVKKETSDISDLFGSEDQDYRNLDGASLPLKSPSSKGWDKFKATHKEDFKYDIELKKQRQDSVKLEPEDVDYRMSQSQPGQARPMAADETVTTPTTPTPDINDHAQILLQANDQLRKGIITHEQHQELLRQLGELMHLQKLEEEEDRRRSIEKIETSETLKDDDLRGAAGPAPRDTRSPDRPLERYKIPRKTREASPKKGKPVIKGQLNDLYPDAPQTDYRVAPKDRMPQLTVEREDRRPQSEGSAPPPLLDDRGLPVDRQPMVSGPYHPERAAGGERPSSNIPRKKGLLGDGPPCMVPKQEWREPPEHLQDFEPPFEPQGPGPEEWRRPPAESQAPSDWQPVEEYPEQQGWNQGHPDLAGPPGDPRVPPAGRPDGPYERRLPKDHPDFHRHPGRGRGRGRPPPPHGRPGHPEDRDSWAPPEHERPYDASNLPEDHPDWRPPVEQQDPPQHDRGLEEMDQQGPLPEDLPEDHPDWRPAPVEIRPPDLRPHGRPGHPGERYDLPEEHPDWRPQPERPGPPHGRPGPPGDSHGPPHGRPGPPSDSRGPPHGRPGPPGERHGPPHGRPGPPSDSHGPPHGRLGPPSDSHGPPYGRPGPPGDRHGPPHGRPGLPGERFDLPEDQDSRHQPFHEGPPDDERDPHWRPPQRSGPSEGHPDWRPPQRHGPPGERRELPEGHPDWRPPQHQGPQGERRELPEGHPDWRPPKHHGPQGERRELPEGHPDWRPPKHHGPQGERRELPEGHPDWGPPKHHGPQGERRELPEGHPDWRPPQHHGPQGERRELPEGHPDWRPPQQQGPAGEQRELPEGHPERHPHPRHGLPEGHPDRRPPHRQGPPEGHPDWRPPRPGPSTDRHDLPRDHPDWRPRPDRVPAHELPEGHPERRPPTQHPEGFDLPEGHPDRRPQLEREAPPHDLPEGHPDWRPPVRPGGAQEWEQAREEDWQKPHWKGRERPGEPHFHEDAEYRRGGRGRGRFPSRRGKARGRGGPEEFSAWRSPREEEEREWVEERGSGRGEGRGRGRQDRRPVGRGPPNVQWRDQALEAERYRDEAGPPPEEYVPREKAGDKPDHTEHLPAFLGPVNPKPNHHGPGEQHGPAGFRPRMMDPRSQGPRRGMHQERPPHRGPRPMPPSMIRPRGQGPGMFDGPPMPSQVDSYIDKFGDPRFRCFNDMGPEVSEEVVLGKRNYEIKLGAPPRKIQWGNETIEVYADPSKRGVVIDGTLLYKFGERVKEVTIRARKEKIFYHGKPVNLWLDGQQYEVRIDSPPKALIINGKHHRIQVDGRDMMILMDKVEVGKFGEPRFVFIDEERMEMRFDPPPRHILIDNKLCELKLNTNQPCVNIEGKLHGIRFDGGPKEVVINNCLYNIFPDHAMKLRVGNRFHYVSLGGPCFELIVDGKWFEVKFNEEPKEINLGNIVLMVQLKGAPPEVKILPEIFLPPSGPPMPGPPMSGPPMVKPGPPLSAGPYLQPQVPSSMPFPSAPLAGMPPMPHMGMVSSTQQMMSTPPMMSTPQMMNAPAGLGLPPMVVPSSMPQAPLSAPSISGIPGIPGIEPSNPVSSAALVSQPASVPNLLSSLFPIVSKPSLSAASKPTGPIDINSLLNNLVKTGILKQEQERAKSGKREHKPETSRPELGPLAKNQNQEEVLEDIPDKTDFNLKEMKKPSVGAVQRLYIGVQCNSCGARFELDSPEKKETYRRHLDWHFRSNRREKDDQRVSRCRKWYYGVNDWIMYDEMTTPDEGKSNFFEQQNQTNTTGAPATPPQSMLPDGAVVVKCPAATGKDAEDMCNICHEPFEQYWDEAAEEWHLRDAIKVNNKTYHPICYEDYTDVSEGTPSPSALSVLQPDFTSRKTLTYEEASQDGMPHSSFEEERKVTVSDTEVKTDPDSSISESPKTSSPVAAFSSIKSEPMDTSDNVPVKVESSLTEDEIKQEPSDDNVVAEDTPVTPEQISTSFSEHSSNQSIKEEPDVEADTVANTSETSVDGQVTEVKTEPRSPSEATVILESGSPDRSADEEADSEVAIKDEIKPEEMEEEISEANTGKSVEIVPQTSETAHEHVPSMQQELAEEEDAEGEEMEVSMESTQSATYIPTQSTSANKTEQTRVSADNAPHVLVPEHPIMGLPLSRVKSAAPVSVLDISEEVLEISSNASTPTRDELPSPPGEES